jgi:hypothetical protein
MLPPKTKPERKQHLTRPGLWLCTGGLLTLAFGLYRVACCWQPEPIVFTVGVVTTLAGVGLEILRDLWHRRPR